MFLNEPTRYPAHFAYLAQEAENRALGSARHPTGGPNGLALNKSLDDLGAAFRTQLVHAAIIHDRSSIYQEAKGEVDDVWYTLTSHSP
jgi:hypothetical protein